MPEPGRWEEELDPRVLAEVKIVVKAFREASGGAIQIGVAPADRGIGYLYAEGQLLVRDDYYESVLRLLERYDEPTWDKLADTAQRPSEEDPVRIRRVIAGVVLVQIHGLDVLAALEVIDRRFGAGIATPNHVLTVSGGTPSICPATEPQVVYDDIEPYPSVRQDDGGAGVLVYVADTGLLAGAASSHSWLAGVHKAGPQDQDPGDGQQPIPPYTGHGTFVAGVLRCVAPAADVVVADVFRIAGSALESDTVPRLAAALGRGVDIFHLTIAALTRKDLPLIGFEAWLKLLGQYKGTVCVVAAGNSGSRRPTWPAAFPEVVSVGALAGDWRSRASFSNFGGWVDVYAPGRDLVNAYATGTYECLIPPYAGQLREFFGMAKWSGTSFSTPIVTGLIADRMYRTGENGREAATALIAEAQAQAIPGVGAILLPKP
jgi:hypothetical protein